MYFLGELTLFLGLKICQRDKGIFISHIKYIIEMLNFGMEDCKPVSTLMQTSCNLRKDDESKNVGQVARFQTTLKETHVMEVKRIFICLKETEYFLLWYPKGKELSLDAYTDADWASSIEDRRSTSGTYFYLGECLVSWLRKKWSLVPLSTAEA
jgi:hypothetical protein